MTKARTPLAGPGAAWSVALERCVLDKCPGVASCAVLCPGVAGASWRGAAPLHPGVVRRMYRSALPPCSGFRCPLARSRGRARPGPELCRARRGPGEPWRPAPPLLLVAAGRLPDADLPSRRIRPALARDARRGTQPDSWAVARLPPVAGRGYRTLHTWDLPRVNNTVSLAQHVLHRNIPVVTAPSPWHVPMTSGASSGCPLVQLHIASATSRFLG